MRIAPSKEFGRRERQIMDVVYRLGRATVGDVMGRLPNPPTYSAVRAMLRYLEGKGHLRHTRDGVRYVYEPTLPHAEAQRSAIQRSEDHTSELQSQSNLVCRLLLETKK